jgi:hypothetical protein
MSQFLFELLNGDRNYLRSPKSLATSAPSVFGSDSAANFPQLESEGVVCGSCGPNLANTIPHTINPNSKTF